MTFDLLVIGGGINGAGIARDAEGAPLVSGELFVIVDGIKRSSQTEANLPLRGVGTQALALRDGFQMVEGRMFEPLWQDREQ